MKRIELAVIAITLAFVCFAGGFFAGRRAVKVISVGSENRISVTSSVSRETEQAADASGEAPDISDSGSAVQPDSADITVQSYSTDTAEQPGSTAEDEEKPADAQSEYTPSEEATPEAAPTEKVETAGGNSGKININTASHAELTSLPGIGDTIAGRIIEFRELYNGFAGISELMLIDGIGEKKFEAVKDYISVD